MDIQKFIELEKTRHNSYKLLAASFYQPDKNLFVEEEVFLKLSQLLNVVCPEAAEFSDRMNGAVLQYGNDELLVEYARLFVGPNQLIAPPYGSVYLEEGRKVMGESTVAVMEAYKEAGLSLDEHFKELPDHIAAELEFMYYLGFSLAEALEKDDIEKALFFKKKQDYFKQTFLDRWVLPFCQKIKQGTENEFYKALADCLSLFIAMESNADEMPGIFKEDLARI